MTLTKADIRSVLTECTGMGLPADFDDTTPFVIDSFAAAWIQHLLEERYGVVVVLSHDVMGSLDSLEALHAFVNRSQAPPGASGHISQDRA